MPHTVEIRHFGHDVTAATSELRGWLSRQCIEPAEFEYSVGGPGITFRVHFIERSEAEAFAGAFHGWLNDGSDPDGSIRWAFSEPPAAPNSRK